MPVHSVRKKKSNDLMAQVRAEQSQKIENILKFCENLYYFKLLYPENTNANKLYGLYRFALYLHDMRKMQNDQLVKTCSIAMKALSVSASSSQEYPDEDSFEFAELLSQQYQILSIFEYATEHACEQYQISIKNLKILSDESDAKGVSILVDKDTDVGEMKPQNPSSLQYIEETWINDDGIRECILSEMERFCFHTNTIRYLRDLAVKMKQPNASENNEIIWAFRFIIIALAQSVYYHEDSSSEACQKRLKMSHILIQILEHMTPAEMKGKYIHKFSNTWYKGMLKCMYHWLIYAELEFEKSTKITPESMFWPKPIQTAASVSASATPSESQATPTATPVTDAVISKASEPVDEPPAATHSPAPRTATDRARQNFIMTLEMNAKLVNALNVDLRNAESQAELAENPETIELKSRFEKEYRALNQWIYRITGLYFPTHISDTKVPFSEHRLEFIKLIYQDWLNFDTWRQAGHASTIHSALIWSVLRLIANIQGFAQNNEPCLKQILDHKSSSIIVQEVFTNKNAVLADVKAGFMYGNTLSFYSLLTHYNYFRWIFPSSSLNSPNKMTAMDSIKQLSSIVNKIAFFPELSEIREEFWNILESDSDVSSALDHGITVEDLEASFETLSETGNNTDSSNDASSSLTPKTP